MMSDLHIAQNAKMLEIQEIAASLGLSSESIECYGKYKAKIDVQKINTTNANSKLILVTAMSPTPAGEGKTTTTVGLGDALRHIGKKT